MCAEVRVKDFYRVGGMVMCAAVSVMICYRWEREGNVDVCCCYRYGLLQCGETEGNGDVCCI